MEKPESLIPVFLTGGKRTNLTSSDWLENWWVGYGKDESCQFEGSWGAMAILAAQILAHENTRRVAPNLYWPDIPLTEEQRHQYTEYDYHVPWEGADASPTR